MARSVTEPRRQKRIPGGRKWPISGLLPEVFACVQADAKRFNVCPSFVGATIITQHYEDVKKRVFAEQERYDLAQDRRRALRVIRGRRAQAS